MKKKYNYLIGLLFATLFAACSEEEVQPFSDAPGVNFMERTVASNGKVSWGEGYTALSLSVNFVDSFYACVQKPMFLSRGDRDLGVAFQTHPVYSV